MSEIEKYYNGEIIVDFEEETELEKKYNEVAELYSKAVKKKIEYHKEIERLNNIINKLNYGIKELDDMFYETFRISQNGYYSISEWELKDFTNKLQELKGSDK